jgi:hypothetical protein
MRKLWPPSHDDFRIGVWAVLSSGAVSLFGAIFCFLGDVTHILWWFAFPGYFAFAVIAGASIEEANSIPLVSLGVAAWLTVNFVFYYFVMRFVLRAFQPVKGWWPEKRS